MIRVFIISVLFVFAICVVSNQSFAAGSWTGNVNIFYGIKTLDSDDWTANSGDLIIDDITHADGTPITMAELIMEDKKLVSVDKATEFGINIDFGPKSWPVCFAIGLMTASGDEKWTLPEVIEDFYNTTPPYDVTFISHAKVDVSIKEFKLGVKKIFELAPDLRPYVAGGLAWVSADMDLPYGINVDDPYVGVTNYQWLKYKYCENDAAIGYWFSGGAYWIFSDHYNVGIELAYSKAIIDFGAGMELEAGGFHYGLFAGFHW